MIYKTNDKMINLVMMEIRARIKTLPSMFFKPNLTSVF
jgi:hypothetical protein